MLTAAPRRPPLRVGRPPGAAVGAAQHQAVGRRQVRRCRKGGGGRRAAHGARPAAAAALGARRARGGGARRGAAAGAARAARARPRAARRLPARAAHRAPRVAVALLPQPRVVPDAHVGARDGGHRVHQVGPVGVVPARHLPRAAVRRALAPPLAGAHPRLRAHEARGRGGVRRAARRRVRGLRPEAVCERLDRAAAPRDAAGRPRRRGQGAPPRRRPPHRRRLCADASRGGILVFDRAAVAQPEGERRAVQHDDGGADAAGHRGRAHPPLRVELWRDGVPGRPLPGGDIGDALGARRRRAIRRRAIRRAIRRRAILRAIRRAILRRLSPCVCRC